MDNEDFTMLSRDDLNLKAFGHKMSPAVRSRCSSAASVALTVGSQPSDTESVLLMQLSDEIDFTDRVDGVEVERFLQSKPMLEKIHHQAKKVEVSYNDMKETDHMIYQPTRDVLHAPSLQEPPKLGFSRNMEEIRRYLISDDRISLLSENEALKLALKGVQSRHQTVVKGLHLSLHSAEQENKSTQLSLQQRLRHYEDRVHSMEQKLKEYESQVLCQQDNWLGINYKVESLQKTLQTSDMKLQSVRQELEESKQKGLSLQVELTASQDTNQSLQCSLACAEELTQSLRQNISNLGGEIQVHHNNEVAEGERVKSLMQKLNAAEEKLSSLEAILNILEEKVTSLKQNQRTSEEKVHSLQQKLSSAKEKDQMTQHSLSAEQKKVKAVKEGLRSVEEKDWDLQDALFGRERHIQTATAQHQMLERYKKEQEERIQVLIRSLIGSEDEHQSRMKSLENSLKSAKEKVEILQDNMSKMESNHAKQMGQLQQKLYEARTKGAESEQCLRAQMVVLNTKLFEVQTKANKELERTTVYEKELQDTVKDLRHKLEIQTEEKEAALDSLKMRQRDLAEVQLHLQADLLKCSHSCELGRGHYPQRKVDSNGQPALLDRNPAHRNLESILNPRISRGTSRNF